MSIRETLLAAVPAGWQLRDLYVGVNWTLALVESAEGRICAGVASSPRDFMPDTAYPPGQYQALGEAQRLARMLLWPDAAAAAVGLAVLNALQQPEASRLTRVDAADWLAQQSRGRTVAIFGRFPFIDSEIRPQAARVLVFEQEPQAEEHPPDEMADLLPQADLVAITGSSLLNGTLDGILAHVAPGSQVAILGPSTPLSAALLDGGIDALFGVRVVKTQAAIDGVMGGHSFQAMYGLERVSLFR